MRQLHFSVTVETDKATGDMVAVYLQFRDGKSAKTTELDDGGNAFADYDRKGNLLGVELLGPCRFSVLNKLTEQEPAQEANRIKRFMRDSTPRKMVLATK